MDQKRPTHDSLRNFNAYADRNGQDFGQDSPLDVVRPADLERAMQEDPSWQAETARTASGFHRRDATEGGLRRLRRGYGVRDPRGEPAPDQRSEPDAEGRRTFASPSRGWGSHDALPFHHRTVRSRDRHALSDDAIAAALGQ